MPHTKDFKLPRLMGLRFNYIDTPDSSSNTHYSDDGHEPSWSAEINGGYDNETIEKRYQVEAHMVDKSCPPSTRTFRQSLVCLKGAEGHIEGKHSQAREDYALTSLQLGPVHALSIY